MSSTDTTKMLTVETVKHVSTLARLTLTQKEIDQAVIDLSAIFEHIDRLREVDTKGVEPLDHPTEVKDRTREDVTGKTLSQEQVLAIAPAVNGVYIDVPKVLGGES